MHKNKTMISGIVSNIEESHRIPNTVFYKFLLSVPRKSGALDTVPMIVSDKLLYKNAVGIGDFVSVDGEMRTMNKMVEGKSRLVVFNFAHDIKGITKEEYDAIEDKNIVEIQGYIVNQPKYRETAQGKRIADIVLAHNRSYKKESYIPTIAWGIDASFAKNLEVGEQVSIAGRFQSRIYKSQEQEKMAFELSVNTMSLIQEPALV